MRTKSEDILINKFISDNELPFSSSNDIDVNWVDSSGRSLLAFATNPEVAQRLIDLGCDPNFKAGVNNERPLHWLAASDRAEVVEVLIQNGADAQIRELGGSSCFDLAGPETLKHLLKHVTFEMKVSALCFSVANSNIENVKILIDDGVDPATKNSSGFSAYDSLMMCHLAEEIRPILDSFGGL